MFTRKFLPALFSCQKTSLIFLSHSLAVFSHFSMQFFFFFLEEIGMWRYLWCTEVSLSVVPFSFEGAFISISRATLLAFTAFSTQKLLRALIPFRFLGAKQFYHLNLWNYTNLDRAEFEPSKFELINEIWVKLLACYPQKHWVIYFQLR